MELLIESPCQYVWKVLDFFQLPSETGYFLDSPIFCFFDGSYCLRLYPNGVDNSDHTTYVEIFLVRLTPTVPERNASGKFGYRWTNGGTEFDVYRLSSTINKNFEFYINRSYLEENRNACVPDGILTVLCAPLREQSSIECPQSEEAETSDAEEEQDGIPGQSVSSPYHWRSSKMELSIESPCQYVSWKVPDFFQLPSEIGYSVDSPKFRFADHSYCLRLYPNGNKRYRDATYTNLYLVSLSSSAPERNVSCKVGFRWRGERKFEVYHCPGTLNDEFGFCLSRSELEKERVQYVPDGTFTVVCYLVLEESSTAGYPQSEEAGISKAEKEQEGLPGMAKLYNYRRFLMKGAKSDTCIVVSDKEFCAHRSVLRAHSEVFDAMFGHGTAEKESGSVVIDDLDPESFGYFLEYLYTGSLEAGLSDENAFGLYAAADKYDMPALKSECVAHMRRNLSVDSFCDVMALALRYSEEDLQQRAVQFLKGNLARIVVTAKWQQFMIANRTSAKELFITAVLPGEQ